MNRGEPRKEHFHYVCNLEPDLTRAKAEQVKDEVVQILRRHAEKIAEELHMAAKQADPGNVVNCLNNPSQDVKDVLDNIAEAVKAAVEWSPPTQARDESRALLFFTWPMTLRTSDAILEDLDPILEDLRKKGVSTWTMVKYSVQMSDFIH